jgi:hypothetical protein
MRKLVCLLLCVAMVVGLFPGAYAAAEEELLEVTVRTLSNRTESSLFDINGLYATNDLVGHGH